MYQGAPGDFQTPELPENCQSILKRGSRSWVTGIPVFLPPDGKSYPQVSEKGIAFNLDSLYYVIRNRVLHLILILRNI